MDLLGSAAPRARGRRAGLAALGVALLTLAVVAGYLAGTQAEGSAAREGGNNASSTVTTASQPNEADIGFARDMQVHHAQAVEMSFLIRDRSTDPIIDTIAYDIITSQQQQMGQMYAWLAMWDVPQTGDEPRMAWMVNSESSSATPEMPGHDMDDGSAMPGDMDMDMGSAPMPGMATESQLTQLRGADGRAAERLFLRLMIRHHQGGIAMVRAWETLGNSMTVDYLAAAMITAQTVEIGQMEQLLVDRRAKR
ncbi:uncharacterized protein PD653_3930 [Nocardioides sp. PD653]|nr:uncharacterized protein PD653B2_2094 [Nocardioides sp. PD653-B2]GAW56493.1 uncharacterized protein PD653_3930 [Nocardioides sp. PD653]